MVAVVETCAVIPNISDIEHKEHFQEHEDA